MLGDRPVDKIEGPIIRDVLAPIWLSKPETARRVRQRIGAVLDWSYVNGYRTMESASPVVAMVCRECGHTSLIDYNVMLGMEP